MIWELAALKMLAKNATVPGAALQDVISELERTQAKLELTKKSQQELRARAEQAEAEVTRLTEALERFAKIDLTGPVGDAIAWDILNARAILAAHEKGGEE